MNKLIKISLFGLVFLGVLSVPAFSDNAVKMVTYFPVPYAAYNNVFVSQKFDVGTTTGAFTLNLGNNACNNTTLKAANVNLLNITDNSTLSFANDIYTENALFGNKNAKGPVNMKFNYLRINTLNNNSTYAVKDVSAKDWTVHGNMYMAENSFVSNGAALPQCEETVRWKQLKVGDTPQGYYLVCGDGTESTGTSPCDISTHTTVYNACINSGGSWNASATSAETCCTCPGNSVPSGDGSCPTTTTRCYVNTGEKPSHPDTPSWEGIFSCGGSDVSKVPCSPGTICACAEVGTLAWHGEDSYTYYQHLPNGHEIDRDYVRANCVECREVPENECTIILADK